MSKTTMPRALRLLLGATLFCCYLSSTAAQSGHIGAESRRASTRGYDVQHYVIRTSFDVPRKTVNGEVSITLKPLSANFKSFALDAEGMKIERVTLDSGKALPSFQQQDKLLITLDRAYDPAESITVNIRYQARPKRGLYFIAAERQSRYLRPRHIWTQGEPEDNHHWFPCYDFPDDKATTEQYITTGASELAIANGTLVETTNNPDGTRTFHWRMSEPHSTYLTSLIVGDFARLTDSHENIPLEYYTYRGTEMQARRAFGKTPVMIQSFSRLLNYEYPYSRYAQTIVGNFTFGGMENITATTYADTEILSGDAKDELDTSTENLVSHELAHSWFGNLVTCKDWSHLWLNEGLATFMESAFREQQDGREAYLEEMHTNLQRYFSEDPSGNRHPLVNPRYPLSMDLFDETTYKKGAYVIHMLRETVGDDIFWRALNVYLNEFKFSNVETRDLQRVFERTSGKQLEWFFEQWAYKAGYPELRVRANYQQAQRVLTLTVTQTQRPAPMTSTVFRFPVELAIYTSSGAHTEQIEINQRMQTFSFPLDGKPLMVTFDNRASVLKKLDFPKPGGMANFLTIDGADREAHRQALFLINLGRVAQVSTENQLFSQPLFSFYGFFKMFDGGHQAGRMAENRIR